MTLKETLQIEADVIESLCQRSKNGDNQASKILLDYVHQKSVAIDEWKKNQEALKLQKKSK